MIEGLQLSIPRRMGLLRVVLTAGLIISVLLSFPLWAGERSFPCTPVFDNFYINSPLSGILTVLLITLWLCSLVFRWQRLLLLFSILIAFVLISGDVNRLQPWFYIYGSMLLVFVFYNGRVDDSNKFTSYFILLQIILASVYFFCGLSQINSYFVENEFTEIILPLKSVVSERQFLFIKKMGLAVPYILIFTGIGLIVSPARYLAITVALILHGCLLVLLFPSITHQNYALWFSNLVFGAMLLLLFSGKTKQRYFSPSYLLQTPLFYAVVVLFVVMPFFNRPGYWPDYLSSNFRSGRNKNVSIRVDVELYKKLPLYQRSFCSPVQGGYELAYNQWCGNELRVDCFPAGPVFNSIYRYLNEIRGQAVKEDQLAQAGPEMLLLKP